jgi:RNA polymerase sigma-70 factor, ECF subfamily
VCAQCPAALARDLAGSFAQLVEHHQDLVFGLARRMVPSDADAEDLAQDAFVRAFRALRGYDAARIRELHLRGWLAQIVLNLARNRARAAGSQPRTSALEEAPDVAEPRHREPARIAERREETRRWTRLLGQLPERYRTAVALRHVDGLSYPELATALGRPLNTVKSDVHRGVALLRAAYERDEARNVTASVQLSPAAAGS